MNLIYKFITDRNIKNSSRLSLLSMTAFFMIFSFMLMSCNGSKAYFKRGFKLEEQGMVDEAAAAYYGALQRNRNNVDAKIGLKKVGQQVLNKKLDTFIKAKNLNEKKNAVYSFIRVKKYQEKIKRIGVNLDIPPMYETDYETVTQSYLSDLYHEGTQLLEEGDFNEAEANFKEIGKFDSSYKDAGNLEDIAFLEPLYNTALGNLEAGKYRSAYYDFDGVINRDASFKDAVELKAYALESGLITLAVLPFNNATQVSGLDQKVGAYSLDALVRISDPFLKIVDRQNFDNIINEQQLGMSGVIDDETAVNAGRLIGAKTILTGTVLNYSINEGRLQKTTHQGYESYKVKKLNEETQKNYYETKYKSTTYYKYQKRNTVSVSFQYKITSAETGEVLASRIIEDSSEDVIVYADYKGENNNLYPAGNNGVNTSRNAKKELERLLNGRKTITSSTDLSNNLMKDVSYSVSRGVEYIIKDQVK